jgi:hypothetical protein
MGVAVGSTAVAFLVAGVIFPELADGLLRLFVVSVAFVVVAVRAFQAVRPLRLAQDFYSPFEDAPAARAAVAAPQLLRTLHAELDGADDARIARRRAIPASARNLVVAEARRRLSERHGLVLGEPAHRERIRSLLSESTWLLIRPVAAEGRPAAAAAAVPLGRLEAILNEVEGL